jgi:hypothetical protein
MQVTMQLHPPDKNVLMNLYSRFHDARAGCVVAANSQIETNSLDRGWMSVWTDAADAVESHSIDLVV